ncbi:hypothetical protein [Actinobacillus equuli]|uniref:hypothetical protein n=1 Tax=Actinobacillus equuli TaxID=718 RepID=UPI00244153ED|nr:hypothetical protein [Actinobacillus equuli]WGE46476.1 hypothetical protein NYR84_10375 [Actinobacillus equuli subsp. haemolyticus]
MILNENYLNWAGFIASCTTILGGVVVFFTAYSLTVESYSKRNSSIYLQARLLDEQVKDLFFTNQSQRITIDFIEIYKLESILMEKPILTSSFIPYYRKKEEIYQNSLSKLKILLSKHNEEIFKKKYNKIPIALDDAKSLEIKMELDKITTVLIKTAKPDYE